MSVNLAWPCYVPGDLNPQLVGKMGIMNDPSYSDNGSRMGRVGEGVRQALRPNSLSAAAAAKAIHGVVLGSYVLEAAAARSMNFTIEGQGDAVENQRVLVLFVRVPEIHSNIPDPFCGDTNDALCRSKKALIQLHSQIGLPNAIDSSHSLLPGSVVEIEFIKEYSRGLVKKIVSAVTSDLTKGSPADASPISVFESGQHSHAEQLNPATQTPADIAECAANYDNPPPDVATDWNKYASLQATMISKAHKEFLPYVKCFFWRCFIEHNIQILPTGGSYRTYAEQKGHYDRWIARGKTGIPAAYPGRSQHNYGLALDFNAIVDYKLKNGTNNLRFASPKPEWVASGIPDVAESIGLRWLGRSKGSLYDPIHIDAFELVGEDVGALQRRAADEGVDGNKVSLTLS